MGRRKGFMSWSSLSLCITCLVAYAEFILPITAQPCRFSQEWHGRYFQSGLGEIMIRENVITTKGTCVEQSRDYYLFENRDQKCFHCLLLLRQHKNLIQYKESFCTSSNNLKTVCAHIRVETPLYTLVREPSLPIECPFQDAYHFKYSDLVGSHGFCEDVSSYAEPCSSPSKYRFKFKHCDAKALYNGKELDFECLASWKDGSETYLYSRLTGVDSDAKDDRYRCFKYLQSGNEVSMAMSADATCQGLRTAKDGPFLLEFTGDDSGWPQPSCHFPDWLKGVTWRDLAGYNRYNIDERAEKLFISLRNGRKDQITNQFRCKHITTNSQRHSNDVEYTIHTFVTRNCVSSYQCLKFKKLANHIVELHLGKAGQRDSHVYCQSENYENIQILTIDVSHQALTACPRPGMHHTAPSDGCIYRLNVGCRMETTIEIDHSCSPGRPGVTLECVTSWSEGQKSYVLVKQRQADTLNCYSFREEGGVTVFGADPICNRNVTLLDGLHTSLYTSLRNENCRRGSKQTTPFAHSKTATTETDAIEDDWPYSNREDISIRQESSSSADYDDDDKHNDNDDDDEDDDDEYYDEENDESSGLHVEENREASRNQGSHHGQSDFQRQSVTIPFHRPVSSPGKSHHVTDDVIRRNPDDRAVVTSRSLQHGDRKIESKGRKHVATTKPHSTNSHSSASNSLLFWSSYSVILLTTILLVVQQILHRPIV